MSKFPEKPLEAKEKEKGKKKEKKKKPKFPREFSEDEMTFDGVVRELKKDLNKKSSGK